MQREEVEEPQVLFTQSTLHSLNFIADTTLFFPTDQAPQ